MSNLPPTYVNKDASYVLPDQTSHIETLNKFHRNLPSYSKTPLAPLLELARELGVRGIFVKNESSRFGLPAYKILGASWGTFRAIVSKFSLSLEADISVVSAKAQEHSVKLFTATDGNHGRAVARMAKMLQIKAHVFIPQSISEYTRSKIVDEGAQVEVVRGNYDAAVQYAAAEARLAAESGILIQDTSWEGYEEIPSWIIQGYKTMLLEVDSQLQELGLKASVVVSPVGVGSLAHAVVEHYKGIWSSKTKVMTVEPMTAACLHWSLKKGKDVPITPSHTIMAGMECGTVSYTAWPVLRKSIDVSTVVSDRDSHDAIQYLGSYGVQAGPCGAASLAALRRVVSEDPRILDLNAESVIVLLCTEGRRPYELEGVDNVSGGVL